MPENQAVTMREAANKHSGIPETQPEFSGRPRPGELAAQIERFLAHPDSGAMPAAGGWRIEFTHKGRYWHYRRGSGDKREYLRGGKSDGEKRKEYFARKSKR